MAPRPRAVARCNRAPGFRPASPPRPPGGGIPGSRSESPGRTTPAANSRLRWRNSRRCTGILARISTPPKAESSSIRAVSVAPAAAILGPPQAVIDRRRPSLEQRLDHPSAVQISRRFPGRDPDPRRAGAHLPGRSTTGARATASPTCKRQAEGRASFLAGHDGFPVTLDRVDEALELHPERVALRRLQRNPLDDVVDAAAGAGSPSLLQAEELAAARGQVEREIAVGLEDRGVGGPGRAPPATRSRRRWPRRRIPPWHWSCRERETAPRPRPPAHRSAPRRPGGGGPGRGRESSGRE